MKPSKGHKMMLSAEIGFEPPACSSLALEIFRHLRIPKPEGVRNNFVMN